MQKKKEQRFGFKKSISSGAANIMLTISSHFAGIINYSMPTIAIPLFYFLETDLLRLIYCEAEAFCIYFGKVDLVILIRDQVTRPSLY